MPPRQRKLERCQAWQYRPMRTKRGHRHASMPSIWNASSKCYVKDWQALGMRVEQEQMHPLVRIVPRMTLHLSNDKHIVVATCHEREAFGYHGCCMLLNPGRAAIPK